MICTHIALQVRDIRAAREFYAAFCGMKAVHDRIDGDSHVVWMGWGEDPPKFVIVLLEQAYEKNEQPQWQHIGMSVEHRSEVDQVYAKAVAAGIQRTWPPRDAGAIVGYYCGVADPDGNMVEFSHGQRIG